MIERYTRAKGSIIPYRILIKLGAVRAEIRRLTSPDVTSDHFRRLIRIDLNLIGEQPCGVRIACRRKDCGFGFVR